MPKRKLLRRYARRTKARYNRSVTGMVPYRSLYVNRSVRPGLYKRLRSTNVFNVCKWSSPATLTVANGVLYNSIGSKFQLADLADSTSYTPLFDQYRIVRVITRFRLMTVPDSNYFPNTTTNNQNTFFPDIYITVDHDDDTALSGVSAILEYDKVKQAILRPNQWVTYSFRPTPNVAVQSASGTCYSMVSNRRWIDCANATCEYFGLKHIVDCKTLAALNQSLLYEVQSKYYVQFKNQR